ncbi:hypothetical protein MJA45_02975 [Paenibacillus aurantius]|uniref:Uncharacterized protein n=1 Tax=Paenibacillus aurantius TaxID=2918900 RepID=A0AA96RE47_9BACL|nr:hypothetical protein [Paenibacillus aurantius]WNQ12040.1 hypothetical protein MJA45_02975 [Paenibacillus aurantius]
MPAPIYFTFPDAPSASQAMDMLLELGYKARPVLRLDLARGDLTSALEIAQAYGGSPFDPREAVGETEAFASAYGLGDGFRVTAREAGDGLRLSAYGTEEGIRIPAHVVAEDLPEAYMHASPRSEGSYEETEGAGFDPSGDDYDRFPPGIHV